MLTQLCRRVIIRNATISAIRSIHLTAVNTTFWEREKKSGYAKKYPIINKKQVIEGLKLLKDEIKLFGEEMKEKFETDPIIVYRPGETDVAWKFSGLLILLREHLRDLKLI